MNKIGHYKNGNSLAYADFGDPNGYPILIQHGLIASINDRHLFKRLVETGARLVSIARPGYGGSAPYAMKNIGEWGELVSVVADELGLSQFDVLGISSGAPYGYAIGHRLAERVRNVFILSGTPALYDENVLSCWPYPVTKDAGMAEMQELAHELFFSHLSAEEMARDEIVDSMMNQCFGVAQDLRLRCIDWGFKLPDVKGRVHMRHSRADEAVPLVTAELTARLLPDCRLEIRENEAHFSQEVLDDFTSSVMAGNYGR